MKTAPAKEATAKPAIPTGPNAALAAHPTIPYPAPLPSLLTQVSVSGAEPPPEQRGQYALATYKTPYPEPPYSGEIQK